VVLTTYETLKSYCPTTSIGKRRAAKDGLSPTLHDVAWHRVVLDEGQLLYPSPWLIWSWVFRFSQFENSWPTSLIASRFAFSSLDVPSLERILTLAIAHVIRNRSSQTFQAVASITARHRWCLTGTPIQNSIDDFGSLVAFLRITPFDEAWTFQTLFGQSSAVGGSQNWERLRSLVKAVSLRRTKASVGEELKLPVHQEMVEEVFLDDEEKRYYDLMKTCFERAISSLGSSMNCFQLILRLRQLCNHGIALLPEADQVWLQTAALYAEFRPLSTKCEYCGSTLENLNDEDALPCFHQICERCLNLVGRDLEPTGADKLCPLCNSTSIETGDNGYDEVEPSSSSTTTPLTDNYHPSSKVKALVRNLARDKVATQAAGLDIPKR